MPELRRQAHAQSLCTNFMHQVCLQACQGRCPGGALRLSLQRAQQDIACGRAEAGPLPAGAASTAAGTGAPPNPGTRARRSAVEATVWGFHPDCPRRRDTLGAPLWQTAATKAGQVCWGVSTAACYLLWVVSVWGHLVKIAIAHSKQAGQVGERLSRAMQLCLHSCIWLGQS